MSAEAAPVVVQQIDHLNLTVRSLEVSLAFYRELFGFEVVEWGLPSDPVPWAIVRAGEAMLCLYEHSNLETTARYPAAPRVQEMRHFAFRVADGRAFLKVCTARNIPLLFGGPVQWPHSTSFYIHDPTGHQIEVVAWDEDRIAFDRLPPTVRPMP